MNRPDIRRDVLVKIVTGDSEADIKNGRALDCAVLFGIWLEKTEQAGLDALDADQVAGAFFEKAQTL